ncbi:MAG: RNA methyltransferase [Planctomycetes bacterium]|jgi:TrmH family RNA methyltransferase|nr:RNA methyltransferase [Planctomycetota bacterium]MCL4730717.1 RNA methyltransferase [Planctomycetota bacterium]
MPELPKARVKQLRSLKQRKGREELGLFVGEGPLLIEEALKAGVFPRYVVRCEELMEGTRDKIDAVVARCRQEGIEVFDAARADFEEGADTVNSQGLVGVFATPVYELDNLLRREFLTLLVLDNLRDPGNLGTIMRQAAAFDCDGLLLLKGCVDAFNHKAVRASMGGVFHVPVISDLTPEDVMQRLSSAGVWPYVTGTRGTSAFGVSFPPRTAFIIGGESEGVQPFWSERDVIAITIPQSSKVESLNAAVAASIFLAWRYQARR